MFFPCSLFLNAEVMIGMGYSREEIREALTTQKYNEITATYLLLGRKSEVGILKYLRLNSDCKTGSVCDTALSCLPVSFLHRMAVSPGQAVVCL